MRINTVSSCILSAFLLFLVTCGSLIGWAQSAPDAQGAAADDISPFILIGERHGVEDQQLMIAALLLELSKRDKKIGVVLEMIGSDQIKLVETFRLLSPSSPKDFGYAIGWPDTGWPDYRYYAPIFEVIWGRDMLIVPGDPPAADVKRWRKGDWTPKDFHPEAWLGLQKGEDSAAAIKASWADAMQKAHCNQLSTEEVENVARMQMMRDAFMARQMRATMAAGADIVVLVSGRAHIRRDRGVPLYLDAPDDTLVLSVIETDPDEAEGETYQPQRVSLGGALPYDQIILTQPLEVEESICERLRKKGLIQ